MTMETKSAYDIKEIFGCTIIPSAGDRIACSCGRILGTLVDVNGALWLRKGDDDLKYGHGRCRRCKKIWHFNSNEIRLSRLVRRAIIIATVTE